MVAPNMNGHFFAATRPDIMGALTARPSGLAADRAASVLVAERIAGGQGFQPDVGFTADLNS